MSGSERNSAKRVSFSGSQPQPTRSAMRPQTRDSPRDSGVGSSSSDHTSSSGNLDERFATRDFNVHSADRSTLQEAFGTLQDKFESIKEKCYKWEEECNQLRLDKRELDTKFRDECDHSNKLAVQVQDLEQKLLMVEDARDEWATKYYNLYDETNGKPSPTYMSGGSGESSHGESSRSQKDRMKDRINRDNPESPRQSRSSYPPDALKQSKKTSRGHSRSASDRTPYIESIPKTTSSNRHLGSHTASRSERHRGSTNTSSTITRRGSVSIPRPNISHESGDYHGQAYPLPERPRR